MKNILIINGPNLNLLGVREKNIYGSISFENYLKSLISSNPKINIEYFQSNIEGEIINKLHESGFTFDGIILNAAAYTHTSIAISDAVKAIKTPVIEVHISNIFARENYRHVSYLGANCIGSISGFGLDSYKIALKALEDYLKL
ncbi:MAG: type II 3-dehydroquinate dehydratase [Bacteroidetes bacterium CG2_30_33_31]|nr:MAG: type II 3-dehydroquinate dehydratase [Bacteroidetes bacterium CG2_30_33_31]